MPTKVSGKLSMTFSRSRADKKRDYKLIIYAFNQVDSGRTLRIRCVAADSLRFVRLITSQTHKANFRLGSECSSRNFLVL